MADKLFVVAVGVATLVVFTSIVFAVLAIAGLVRVGRRVQETWRHLAAIAQHRGALHDASSSVGRS